MKMDNRLKNRFINIIPYDHSRVILETQEGDPNSDYINANYIDGYNKPKFYIAAQGCNKWSVQDIWRMLWQENSLRIVMLTNLVEKGRPKCEQYWPDQLNEEKSYGDLGVTLTSVERSSSHVIRSFTVRKCLESREIKQFHFTAWPDHGVPYHTSPLIMFRNKVRKLDSSHPGPIIVHCSAGVGRSGTFIALDHLLEQAEKEGRVDLHGLTHNMRANRCNMIQTVEQYIFVYEALTEALKSKSTTISLTEF
ncbi:hypothetical protein HELRODRAFT_104527, partial [Helobdella robusta]|uniref:protein-tyrosine-phosphatase n=1 Tax=Helobdella robusta TaxID=6412 RepID=T1EDM1_HELRO